MSHIKMSFTDHRGDKHCCSGWWRPHLRKKTAFVSVEARAASSVGFRVCDDENDDVTPFGRSA